MCKCNDCCIVTECNNQNDIINDLLYEYVKLFGLRYRKYFIINDCDVMDNLTVFVDCFNKWGFTDELEYVKYLSIFYSQCETFLSWLRYKLPKNIKMSECYQSYDVEDENITGEYYESCILEFKIKEVEL